jgi:hypothetical protein
MRTAPSLIGDRDMGRTTRARRIMKIKALESSSQQRREDIAHALL